MRRLPGLRITNMFWNEIPEQRFRCRVSEIVAELTGNIFWEFAEMESRDIDLHGAWIETETCSLFVPFEVAA